jgi:hypothetical protein
VVSDPLAGSLRFSGASLLLLVSVQVSPAKARFVAVQLNVTLVLIGVVVGVAVRATDPAKQVSTAVLLVMVPFVAVMFELPGAKQVASPVPPMDATAALADLQVTGPGGIWLPKESLPVSANCCVPPTTAVAVAGVTLMDANGAAVQVKFTAPVMLPLVAEMAVVPCCRQVATPLPLIVAIPLLVAQLTEFKVCDGPELKMPVAVY